MGFGKSIEIKSELTVFLLGLTFIIVVPCHVLNQHSVTPYVVSIYGELVATGDFSYLCVNLK